MITMRWSWDDRRRERKNCWREKHRLSCVVLRARFWIEKKWKSWKFWERRSNFELKKESLTLFSNDSKFDLFILTFMICFVDLFQSEMMLLSSKKMKDDYEKMKFEFSNWFDNDVEIDKANWLRDSVANFDDDDFSNWQNIRVETIQKIVFSNWLRNCVEIDEKIKEWIDVNQCDDDEKKSEKEKSYKSAFEIFFSTTIIEVIIVIIIIIIIIIIEKNVDFCEDFDILFICFVEFFSSVSSLEEEDWEEISKFEFEESLKEKFVCAVCFFAEFALSKDIHFDCEFCDSTLILSRFSASEFVASLIFLSTLENFANENQSSVSSLLMRKKEIEIEKKIVFISCFFVCVFVSSSIESLFVLVFFVSELNLSIFCVESFTFLNTRKCKIVQRDTKFLEKSIIIDDDVTSFCATNDSNFSSQNKNNRAVEEEKKKLAFRAKLMRFCVDSEENSDWLKHFAIDFVFDCFHVEKIERLLCVISFVEIESKRQKESSKKKNKKRMSFEIFNQYRESRSTSNENDANLIQEVSAKKELSKSTSREEKTALVTKKIVQLKLSMTISSLQVLQMLLRWLIIMLASKTFETFFFDDYNITKFFDRYANLCLNYDLEEKKKIRRLFRYCDFINEQYVRAMINANVFEWKDFCKTFCKDYKDKDLNQQLHSLNYLKIFKNKVRTFLNEISQYCRQYTIISEKLIKTKKLQKTLRSAWFLQKLLEKFSEKFAIRCSLNENDENKMRFENLIKQTLQLIKSRSAIIKTRKTNYKTKRTTTLMKKMKSAMKKNVSEHLINLLKAMKSRVKESISKIDVKLDDLIEIMKKMTINVNNLINCVFLSNDRDNSESSQDYQLYMFSRYSSSNQSLMLSSRSFSMFLQNVFSQNVLISNMLFAFLNNEISRSSFTKCIYCYEKNHLYKKECAKFNENFKIKKMHLQKKRIHLDFYNLDVFHVRMILYKSQRQCVENTKKLVYSNRVVAIVTKIHIVRLKKNADLELFIDEEKKEIVLMNHEFYVNVDVIFATIRSKSKMSRKSAKHHEFIRRILKRKVEKKKKLFISKILRSEKWKKATMKKKNDVRNRVTTKISQKNIQKAKKNSKKMKKRSRFVFNKKKIKAIKKIKKIEKIEKIVSLSIRKRISNKLRIIDIWRNEMNEKKFLIKLKNAQIIFFLIEIIVFVSFAQKIFFKILFDEDVIKFHVNSIRSRSTTQKRETMICLWIF